MQLERRRMVEAKIVSAHAGTMVAPASPRVETAVTVTAARHMPSTEAIEATEKLPARNIGGVMADGTRITRTIPAGAIGNEQPIVHTMEEWASPELQVLVMTRTSDPRTGEYSYRLSNVVRADPSPSLFDLPPDYTLKESDVRQFVMPAVREAPSDR